MRPRGGIALLHERFAPDARPDELDALVQAEQVGSALRSLGWQVATVHAGADLDAIIGRLETLQPGLVFNLVESLAGNAALISTVPALLAGAGFCMTGCDSQALYLTSNKLLAKRWMRCHDLPTPDWIGSDEAVAASRGPWIVKSVWEHASLGLDDGCIVKDAGGIRERLDASRAAWGGSWFAERYVDGREFNISVLEIDGRAHVLPVAEIEFDDYPSSRPKIVGYAAKWEPAAVEYQATRRAFPELPAPLEARIATLVETCWRVFGLGGYARVDLRMDADERLWILEINANPCLSQDAGFVAAANAAGIDYETVVAYIVAAGLQRQT